MRLRCSHYVPHGFKPRKSRSPPPCVIYCHGNSGSRLDATQAAISLLQLGISVCTFDFSGSGLSDGAFVTLGQREVLDVQAVIEYLRSTGRADRIGLWGR